MTDRLSIYNGALLMTGSRRLASLSENVESRRVLDTIWDSGALRHCLEKGFWNHAMRTQMLDYSPSITPAFGYRYAFDKPEDLVKIVSLCTDEYFTYPLHRVQDEGNYWFADEQQLYVRYVSDDASYGLDYSKWPDSFTRYVEGYFALRAIKRLTDSQTDAEDLKKEVKSLLREAKANDALKEPTTYTVPTGWQRARHNQNLRNRPPYR